MWQLYILKCRDGSLYTGITTDLDRRVKAHNDGKGCKYTRSRLPVSLAYSESLPTRSEALKREMTIKGWTRARKLALIDDGLEG